MRKNELSERLHRVREELCGGSNKEFAERLGVSPQYASAICTGHARPKAETLERLLEVFPQVRRAWLLQGEGEMLSGGATGWTTSMSSTPEELSEGSVTLPAEFLAMFRRQAESMLSKDEQISQLVDLVEKKSPTWSALESTKRATCSSKSGLTAKMNRVCKPCVFSGLQAFVRQ
jgi:transcriptional regulator with XRE-family HTH domain